MNASKRSPALFAVIGILAAFLFAVVWIVAAMNDPTWVFGESMVSDLGVSKVQLTADLFKYGCIITGIMVLAFGAGMAYTGKCANRFAGALIGLAGICLALVGAFPADGSNDVHNVAASLFFVLLVAGIIASMYGDWNEKKSLAALISGVLFLIIIATAVGKPLSYVEAVAVICGLLWLFAQSGKMIVALKE